MSEKLMMSECAFLGDQEDYDAIRVAVKKLSTSSQEQFEKMKNEKWYNRVFDMVTFSQKSKKRLAEQISTITQAQQIFIELLLRLSSNDVEISQIVCESMEDIRRIQEQNIYLLARIERLENVSLGITPDMDIKRLSERGKQVLCGCLYEINERDGDASEAQKKYANAVISYLATDVQMDNPIVALEKLDEDLKKRILLCCMEYMFLRDCTQESFANYKEFIDEFDLGNKTVNRIKKRINSQHNLKGVDGFFLKYASENFEELDEFFPIEIDAVNVMDEEEPVEMEDETISSILQIRSGDTKLFKNKNLHIAAFINCEGNLEIDHCVVYYNESEAGDEITLAKGANLYIRNSLVICKGFDKNYFISCSGGNNVVYEKTTFIDCSYMIISRVDINFTMRMCELKNCYGEFVRIWIGEDTACDISSNKIIQDNLSQFHTDNQAEMGSPRLLSISSLENKKNIKFYDNIIREDESFRKAGVGEKGSDNHLKYLDCRKGDVFNCSFIGISTSINVGEVRESKFENCTAAIFTGGIIDNCVFQNCTNVITTDDNTQITNCQFVSCYNKIIESESFFGGVRVEFCQFVNTKNFAVEKSRLDIFKRPDCITFRRAKESKARVNYLKKCIFDGVEMGDNFLIAAKGYEKPSGVVTYIEECDFKNCSTKRSSGKIIKEYIQYDTLFKKNLDFHANSISNCRGLDKINKEGVESDNVVIQTTATTGNIIGASIANTAAGTIGGMALAVVGGPVGLGVAAGITGINAIKK